MTSNSSEEFDVYYDQADWEATGHREQHEKTWNAALASKGHELSEDEAVEYLNATCGYKGDDYRPIIRALKQAEAGE